MPKMEVTKNNATLEHGNNLNWPEVDTLPEGDPSVILAFHGLMGLAYNSHDFCEIGLHSSAPKHEFNILVFDGFTAGAQQIYSYNFGVAGSSPVDVIRFDIVHPKSEGVSFYMPPTGGGGESDLMS